LTYKGQLFNLITVFEFFFKKLRIFNYFLIAFVFFTVLFFIRNIISANFTKKVLQPSEKQNETNTAIAKIKDIMSYSLILEQNPFGPPAKLVPLTGEPKAGESASLSELILVGTAVGPKNLSYAIFEDKTHPDISGQEVFKYGANVYGHGTLTRIEKEWVELTQGINTYKIHFIETQVNELHVKNIESPQTSFAKKIGEKEYLLDQRKVQQALNSPEQILTDARLLPNIKNGVQEGFSISEVRPGGLYESLGLRNGDILLRINNLEISKPEVAIQAMSALRGMNTVNLDIIRNSSKLTMSYQIR